MTKDTLERLSELRHEFEIGDWAPSYTKWLITQLEASLKREAELVAALKTTLSHLYKSYETRAINAIYHTPAKSMRLAAEAIEKKDSDIDLAREVLARHRKDKK